MAVKGVIVAAGYGSRLLPITPLGGLCFIAGWLSLAAPGGRHPDA